MSAARRPTKRTEVANTSPAHRPSRRSDIIDAAIRLFSKSGFVDASMADVAEEADVAVTAVYYHFAGKDELFDAAVHRVFESVSTVVIERRPSPDDPAGLDEVIDAVWNWIDQHPEEATLLFLQLPGATPQIAYVRQEFEEQHVQRSFAYFGSGRQHTTAAQRATLTLAARTLVDLLISLHTMRLLDGPLSDANPKDLRKAIHSLAGRLTAV